jgi:hypothetical protein
VNHLRVKKESIARPGFVGNIVAETAESDWGFWIEDAYSSKRAPTPHANTPTNAAVLASIGDIALAGSWPT